MIFRKYLGFMKNIGNRLIWYFPLFFVTILESLKGHMFYWFFFFVLVSLDPNFVSTKRTYSLKMSNKF